MGGDGRPAHADECERVYLVPGVLLLLLLPPLLLPPPLLLLPPPLLPPLLLLAVQSGHAVPLNQQRRADLTAFACVVVVARGRQTSATQTTAAVSKP